jgi:hypothetical protein
MKAERSDSEDLPDVVLFLEELRYSGKAVVEDHPDKARSTARVRICLELGFLKPINRWL